MTSGRKPDPHAAREARNYERPIHSREAILEHLSDRKPLGMDRLAQELGLASEEELEALRRRLNAMERDGQLVRNRRGQFGVASKMNLVRGRVIGHPDGFGFLVPDDGGEDVFLTGRQMRPVMHGDRVLARLVGVDRRGRREGALVEVLERNTHEVVGRYYVEGGLGFVTASNKRIAHEVVIPAEASGGAADGQIVVAVITDQPSMHSQPIGRVVEVLGDHMAPGMEIEIAIRSYEIPDAWPEEVGRETERFAEEVPADAIAGREDLRALPLVTIDGEDAKDFDDAVYCERDGRGWRLLVAIADVSHYVRPDSALDEEARRRGTSVYFPQHVVPMLPEILSNHLCSLRPDVDRLCMVCELRVGQNGQIRGYRFFEGVMRSHARLLYDEVAAMLVDGDAATIERHGEVFPHLQNLHSVYTALLRARERRGAIDFESSETRIVFGEGRKIERIVPVARNDAHRLIEECMIAANVAAAAFLLEHSMPALYRTHPAPDTQKLDDLRTFLGGLGLRLGGRDKPGPKDYARLLAESAGRADRRLVDTVVLRSLSHALYGAENTGHFGLALESYTHFTSPIRRYPDLVVHRAIRHAIAGRTPDDFTYTTADVERIGDHCSMTERRADEATRDAVDWLKCEYMLSEVGREFDGIIVTVTSFGLFVELDDIYVQGLVHVTALGDDYYRYEPLKHLLLGERTGAQYRLADRIRVRVARVDLDERNIDFVPADQVVSEKRETAGTKKKKRGPASRRKKGARKGDRKGDKKSAGEA